MKTEEDKRWERVQQVLIAEMNGDTVVRVASTRTLFGIKSHAEEVIEKVAAEDQKRCEELLKKQRAAELNSDGDSEESPELNSLEYSDESSEIDPDRNSEENSETSSSEYSDENANENSRGNGSDV